MEESILVKHIVNEATVEESKAVLAWIEASETNKQEFEHLRNTWQTSAKVKEQYFDSEKAWQTFRAKNITSAKLSVKLYRSIPYAAAAVILIGLIIGINSMVSKPSFSTAKNESNILKEIILEDGSTIQLGKGEVKYPEKFNEKSRPIALKGEAYFKVETKPNKKFIVQADDCQVEVLGTQFKVENLNNQLRVSVLEGKVAVTTPNGSTLLGAGETAVYDKNKRTLSNKKQKSDDFYRINKQLDFNNITLEEAADQISLYYNTKIILDPAIKDLKINTKFKDESLSNLLKVLELTLNIKVENKEEIVTLKRKEVKP